MLEEEQISLPHRSFEDRFIVQFGVSPDESDTCFDSEELNWSSPQGAEVW